MKHVHPSDVQDDPVQQPKQPNLPPNGYIVILLKFVYSNISICQSCGGKFYLNFFKPTLTHKEIYIVSKTKVFSSTLNFRKGRNQMNLVMFILLSNFVYIFANNRCFTSLLIQIEQNVNMHLQEVHVFTLSSAGIMP